MVSLNLSKEQLTGLGIIIIIAAGLILAVSAPLFLKGKPVEEREKINLINIFEKITREWGEKEKIYFNSTDVDVKEVVVNLNASLGSFKVSFEDTGLPFQAEIEQQKSSPKPVFEKEKRNQVLYCSLKVEEGKVHVFLDPSWKYSVSVKTGTGAVTFTSITGVRVENLFLSTIVGAVNLNLQGLIRNVSVKTETGAINLSYIISEPLNSSVDCKTGIGAIKFSVAVPEEAGLSIHAETGVGSVKIKGDGLKVVSSSENEIHYKSNNFDAAKSRLDINLFTGTGSIKGDVETMSSTV